jgi:protein-S-isoprenylcysteine O-methyltransferase
MDFRLAVYGLWAVLVLYWIVTAVGNKRTVYRYRPGARLVFLVLFLVIVSELKRLPASFQERIFAPTPGVEWTGITVLAAGVAFAIWARATLGRNWSGNPTLKEDHELVTRGPYRWVRHPIYTGIVICMLGTLIARGRRCDLVTTGYLLVAVILKMGVEEGLMLRQFPSEYPAYQTTTRRLIPWIW